MPRLPSSKAWLGLFAVLWLLCASWAAAEVAVPPLKARVTDLTGTLQPGQQAALEKTLQAFENSKGSQIAVLIVPTTRPETIEQYAIRVAEAWKLGRKGVDDGVLLLVARDDRNMRIEVGYGLEGAIPDAVAKRIVSEIITPHFKQDDYFGGIRAGVDRIIKVIEGEPLPEKKSSQPKGGGGGGDWLAIGFVLAVVVGARCAPCSARLSAGWLPARSRSSSPGCCSPRWWWRWLPACSFSSLPSSAAMVAGAGPAAAVAGRAEAAGALAVAAAVLAAAVPREGGER